MSLKQLIQDMAPEGEQIEPTEFNQLMFDDQKLSRELTADDKKYLEEFVNVELLSFTNTELKALTNLPDLPDLKRIELSQNDLSGAELKHLLKYDQLHTIKYADNKVATFEEVEAIKALTICNLSLEGNPVAEKEGYREKMFEIFADLEVLDGLDKDGNEVDSMDDFGEEGEAEMEELDEETLKKLREQGFAVADDEDYDDEEDFDDDGEEGEDDESYGDEEGDEESEEPQPKRRK
jgi:hypothetical protein